MTVASEFEEDHSELGLRPGLPEIRTEYLSNTIPQVHPFAENYYIEQLHVSMTKMLNMILILSWDLPHVYSHVTHDKNIASWLHALVWNLLPCAFICNSM
jgi:hypothetical protein